MCSAWKAAYLASKLPLASSADALTREIILESSCRRIHMSFLPEIQSMSYSVLLDVGKAENNLLYLFRWGWPHNARKLVDGICSSQACPPLPPLLDGAPDSTTKCHSDSSIAATTAHWAWKT